MGYRTLVLTEYEIDFGNQIGESYGQVQIYEALEKLSCVKNFEFYSEDTEDFYMKRLEVYECFVEAYEKFLKNKDEYIKEMEFIEEELEVLDQIYDLFKMEPRPKYLDSYGCLIFMSI